jgi:hypothetical protein
MKRIAVALLALSALPAQAAMLTYEFNSIAAFGDGMSPPAGATPWLTAVLDDGGTPGSVELTLAATNLVGQENARRWWFNLEPASISGISQTAGPAFEKLEFDPNGNDSDGAGSFDLFIEFDNGVFSTGAMASFLISGTGLTADSFFARSAPDGLDPGGFLAAANIRDIGGQLEFDTTVAPVPVPAAVWLMAPALLGLLGIRRRP